MCRAAAATILAAVLSLPAAAHAQMAQAMMSVNPEPQATGCKLAYGGGPLIQKVKVFDIFYSPGNTLKDDLAGFFGAVTQSAHFDWLTEYNVTNYKIGRGSYIGMYEDSNAATSKTIDDSAIGPYLSSLIDAKKIPAPDDDTIYFIYFPYQIKLTLQGVSSCSYFCAYHNSYQRGSQMVRYAVMPDMVQGACSTGGCGTGTALQKTGGVASHELIEAVTDPDGNSAWVDSKSGCGEIGDICNGQTGPIGNYTVQKEWSNKLNACIVTNPNVSLNDFTVAAAPAMLNVPAGGSAMTALTLTKVAGMAENATLSAAAVPGLTTSFSPTSVTSDGGKSMLTVTAAPTAMVGSSLKVTVKAMGTAVAPTTDVTVMVVAPPDMAMPPDMAQPPSNGGSGGTGGGGSGGTGGGGSGGGNGTGGNGGSGGNGNNGNGSGGCSLGGGEVSGAWAAMGVLLIGLAFRRRRV